ncbi:DNA-directed RNA polymerase subunit RPB2 [uncultured virus]|nr:DNA-directed RNA polymerase subunit RPB2 [uncultured virus]
MSTYEVCDKTLGDDYIVKCGNRGDLKFGEMERDAAISHGASSFMYVSDAYQTAFCQTCGTFAIYDDTIRLYEPCRLCGDDKNFGRCTIPHAYELLIHLLAAPGINLRLEFVTSDRIFHNDCVGTLKSCS